mmetsp:Transcript_1362/g.2894  ORF Transcript_1362/g.2894 Transcript_1362/m.2894 type:complete len:131 (-) Transcript_1362:175-567(-)
MEELAEVAVPQVLQVEMHPLLPQAELRSYCEARGILIQAYGHHHSELREYPPLVDAAASLGSDAVGLTAMRWSLQAGAAIIPRSRRAEYIAANKRVFEHPPLPNAVFAALAAAVGNRSLYSSTQIAASTV